MDGAWGMILGKKILLFGVKLLDARFALVILEVPCVLRFLFVFQKGGQSAITQLAKPTVIQKERVYHYPVFYPGSS
jgi:hypothetical protein